MGELVKGPLGEVFDHQQLITDVSGCGNNWYTVCVCVCVCAYNVYCIIIVRSLAMKQIQCWSDGHACFSNNSQYSLWKLLACAYFNHFFEVSETETLEVL